MTDLLVSPSVSLVDGRPCVSSLAIAEHFGKPHRSVLRDIRSTMAKCPEEFNAHNFVLVKYTDAKGEERDAFNVFQDGFILVVMGYTGKQAMQIKLAYIMVFNAMRDQLAGEQPTPALTDAPITPDQQCTLQAMVRALVEKGGIYAAIWSRFNNHFRLGSYKQLPQSRMSEAVDYLARFEVAPKALPEAAPEPEQSNVYFHNSPEFILRELEKKHEQAVERCNELSRWAWVMEREINRLATPLYREIMRKKLGADVALSNAGVEAMGGPVYMGAERIVGAMEEFATAVRQAAIFAKAMRGSAQLEGRAHLSLAR